MATEVLIFRIADVADFRAHATREAITAETTLLDTFHVNASGEVILHGWSPKVVDFFMNLLRLQNDELHAFFQEFEAEVRDVWSIASFHEKYVRQAEADDDNNSETRKPGRPTQRMRWWFNRWWGKNGEGFRGIAASDLVRLVMPAFYIGEARTFMSVTHDCFLHTNREQASSENAKVPEGCDLGGIGAIDTWHPLLGTSP